MNICPCCSSTLLRHVRHSQVYWYCNHCRQEMPNLGDWLQANAVVNPVEQPFYPTQKILDSKSITTRFNQEISTLSWLILDSKLTAA